ncbi:hypothetical protein Y032_0934g3106 [Ancylostoma ceylanicum]|nr:hypothetical protein Y032_0934g3106 [Ancylostoma ceylanicum]
MQNDLSCHHHHHTISRNPMQIQLRAHKKNTIFFVPCMGSAWVLQGYAWVSHKFTIAGIELSIKKTGFRMSTLLLIVQFASFNLMQNTVIRIPEI